MGIRYRDDHRSIASFGFAMLIPTLPRGLGPISDI